MLAATSWIFFVLLHAATLTESVHIPHIQSPFTDHQRSLVVEYDGFCDMCPAEDMGYSTNTYPATEECLVCTVESVCMDILDEDYTYIPNSYQGCVLYSGDVRQQFANCDELSAFLCSRWTCADFCVEDVQENHFLRCQLSEYPQYQRCKINCNASPTTGPSLKYQGNCSIGPLTDHPATYDCASCAWNSVVRPLFMFDPEYDQDQLVVIGLEQKFANCDELVAKVCSDLNECTDNCIQNVQETDFLRCGLTIDEQFQECLATVYPLGPRMPPRR